LEEFLKDYNGSLILISHDRAFLDNVTSRTIEISLGSVYDYDANYSRYVELRKERKEQQMAAYRNQQKLIEDTQDFIERFRYKATKATQVQSRIKQLEKINIIEVDEEDLSVLNIKFPPAPRSGGVVVEAKELSKSFGEKMILDHIDFTLERGEKVAFVGRNGEGKSTFSKVIIGEHQYTGHLKIGHNVKLGYFAQNQDEIMDENATVYETLDEVAVGDIRTKLRDILGAFLFSGQSIDKKVKVLSGGERSRLAMAKLLLEPYNLLLLDEPTNHMDMRSKDVLKKALLNYDGTLIVVSHDREFLDGLVNKVYEFRDHKIKQYLGGIYEFLRKRKLENLNEVERKEAATSVLSQSTPQSKVNYEEKKEFERGIRKITNQISQVEKEIHSIEKELESINHLFETSVDDRDPGVFGKYAKLQDALASQMDKWEKLQISLENYKKSASIG
jgi:ATP-binding cassette, subfamily F, member 3